MPNRCAGTHYLDDLSRCSAEYSQVQTSRHLSPCTTCSAKPAAGFNDFEAMWVRSLSWYLVLPSQGQEQTSALARIWENRRLMICFCNNRKHQVTLNLLHLLLASRFFFGMRRACPEQQHVWRRRCSTTQSKLFQAFSKSLLDAIDLTFR